MHIRRLATAAAGLLLVLGAATASAADLRTNIEAAELAFAGEAFAAESIGGRDIIDVLSGSQIVEAVYDASSGELITSEAYGAPRLIQQVSAALDRAVLSLIDAIDAAEAAVGPGDVLQADLLISRRVAGRAFVVDIRTDAGVLDVVVNSVTGQIIRIIPD